MKKGSPPHARVCTRHNFSQLLMSKIAIDFSGKHLLPTPGVRCPGVGQKLGDLHLRAEVDGSLV